MTDAHSAPTSRLGFISLLIGLILGSLAGLACSAVAISKPKFQQIFEELAIELPALTEAFMAIPLPMFLLVILSLSAWPYYILFRIKPVPQIAGILALVNSFVLILLVGACIVGLFLPLIQIIHHLE